MAATVLFSVLTVSTYCVCILTADGANEAGLTSANKGSTTSRGTFHHVWRKTTEEEVNVNVGSGEAQDRKGRYMRT